MLNSIKSNAPSVNLHHAPSRANNTLKTVGTLVIGALGVAEGSRTAASIATGPAALAPAPALPSQCPALPLPCSCVAVPPPVPTAPIAQDGLPDVFVTTPSPFKDEGVRIITAQRPAASNATSLFAFNCIDSMGDNALSSISCVDATLGLGQPGILSPIDALNFVLDPLNGVANGPNQVLLSYTTMLKSIYDRPCTHTSLAQGLAYDLHAGDVCGILANNAATLNDTRVVTHFQEALRDALHEPVPQVCYDNGLG